MLKHKQKFSPFKQWLRAGIGGGVLIAATTVQALIQGASVSASGDDGNIASNTLDGDFSTRWSANGDNQWLRYDLGETKRVDAVDIAFFNGDQRVAYFDIRVSADGNQWQSVFSGESSGSTSALQRFGFSPVNARHVEIRGHGNSSNMWNSITEVSIVPALWANASANDGNLPSHAIDNNFESRWSAQGDGQWLSVDLGGHYAVSALDIAFYRGDVRRAQFDIQLSLDGQQWRNVFSGESSGNSMQFERFTFAESVARHLRVVGHGNTDNAWNSISELRLSSGTRFALPPVRVFQHYDYGGYAVALTLGRYTTADLLRLGAMDNDISSVQVPEGYRVTLFDNNNFSGTQTALSSDTPRLLNNDTASSIVVSRAEAGNDAGFPEFCAQQRTQPVAGEWQSSRVRYNSQGQLSYAEDSERNRLPDFSYVGYHYGEKPLPNVPVVTRLSPVSGDNTQRIQQALDAIGNRQADSNGHRGTLLLAPGRYTIDGTIRITKSGVVLRGSGDGSDPQRDTILFARGNSPAQRTVIVAGSGDTRPYDVGSPTNITDRFVQVGAMSVTVQDPSRFRVGATAEIRHYSSQRWIDAVDGGGVINDDEWEAGKRDLVWRRVVRRIEGSRVYFDAPIFNHLNRDLTQSTVAPVLARNLFSEIGVESLRIDIQNRGGEDEAHAWHGVGMIGVENAWVRDVTVEHFGGAGVFTRAAQRVTVTESRALDPVGIRTGGRFYNFDAEGDSELILFSHNHATHGRHNFVTNGSGNVNGVVFYRSTAGGTGDSSEGHRQWNQGLLYDNVHYLQSGAIRLLNRGDGGTSHGWSAAHSAVWNSNAQMVVQKPPTAQNYAISADGEMETRFRNPGGPGFLESRSGELFPQSLYEAQLCERLKR